MNANATDSGLPARQLPPADTEPRVPRPMGLVELRDGAGTMVGDLTRTSGGLTVYSAKLKEKDGDQVREFHKPVFIPWSSVLYWSVSPRKDGAHNGA